MKKIVAVVLTFVMLVSTFAVMKTSGVEAKTKKGYYFAMIQKKKSYFGYIKKAKIVASKKVVNRFTDEAVYIMRNSCNEIEFDVCINEADLLGEPAVGRRFKGNIWMQGMINYPDN